MVLDTSLKSDIILETKKRQWRNIDCEITFL